MDQPPLTIVSAAAARMAEVAAEVQQEVEGLVLGVGKLISELDGDKHFWRFLVRSPLGSVVGFVDVHLNASGTAEVQRFGRTGPDQISEMTQDVLFAQVHEFLEQDFSELQPAQLVFVDFPTKISWLVLARRASGEVSRVLVFPGSVELAPIRGTHNSMAE